MINIYSNTTDPQRRLIKFGAVGITLALGVWAFFWIYGHSVISVKIANPDNQEMTYTIVNQSTKQTDTIETSSSNLRRTVPKGDYEVLVTRPENSYFAVVKTKPFLAKTTIDAKLQSEKARTFVGNEPGPCPYYDQSLLISHSCEGGYSELLAHLQATDKTPTITNNEGTELERFSFGGIIRLGDRRLVLTEASRNPEPLDIKHDLVEIDDNLRPISAVELAGLEPTDDHHIEKYRSGFVVYSKDYGEIKYYSSPTANPDTIQINPPDTKGLKPVALSIFGEKIALLYSAEEQDEEHEHSEGENGPTESSAQKSKRIVQVFAEGKTRSIPLDDGAVGLSSAKLCSDRHLCDKNGQDLSIIDISGDKQTTLFKVVGVLSVETDGTSIFIERDNDIVAVDIASRTGAIQYSYGAYTTACGVHLVDPTGYVLCMVNPKDNIVALYINPKETNSDSIDKKVLSLLDQPFIDSVSAYKSYLYIVPELGEPVYDPATKGYAPDPSIRQKTSEDISRLINEINIDRSKYTIINTQL